MLLPRYTIPPYQRPLTKTPADKAVICRLWNDKEPLMFQKRSFSRAIYEEWEWRAQERAIGMRYAEFLLHPYLFISTCNIIRVPIMISFKVLL